MKPFRNAAKPRQCFVKDHFSFFQSICRKLNELAATRNNCVRNAVPEFQYSGSFSLVGRFQQACAFGKFGDDVARHPRLREHLAIEARRTVHVLLEERAPFARTAVQG